MSISVRKERFRWKVTGALFLVSGVMAFVVLAYVAISGIVTCGSPIGCTNRTATDIFSSLVPLLALFFVGAILLAVGASIFGLFVWGLWFEGKRRREHIRIRPPL